MKLGPLLHTYSLWRLHFHAACAVYLLLSLSWAGTPSCSVCTAKTKMAIYLWLSWPISRVFLAILMSISSSNRSLILCIICFLVLSYRNYLALYFWPVVRPSSCPFSRCDSFALISVPRLSIIPSFRERNGRVTARGYPWILVLFSPFAAAHMM